MRQNWFWIASLLIHALFIGYISWERDLPYDPAEESGQKVSIEVESFKEMPLRHSKVLKKRKSPLKEQQILPSKKQGVPKHFEETYLEYLNATLDRNKSYPLKAKRMGDEGRVILFLTIEKEGRIKNLFIKSSSNSKILDQASIKLVKKSAPFKALPERLDHIDVDVPIDWSL